MPKKTKAEKTVFAEEKAKRAARLIIANTAKARHSAELVIANAEKAKRAAVLLIANIEKANRASKLISGDRDLIYENEERVKLAAESVIADIIKTKRDAETAIANIDRAKRAAELVIADRKFDHQADDKAKRAAETFIADAEKAKRESVLVIANIKKAKRSAELVIANVEKVKHSAELVIANKELFYQKSEKARRAAELVIANVEKAKRWADLVIANIKKAKRAAEFVVTSKELVLVKEKEKLVLELIAVNKELSLQINERKRVEESLENNLVFSDNLLKTIPFGMDILDETGTILFQSDYFRKILGENGIGKKCWELIRDDKKRCTDCPLIKGITVGESGTFESRGILGDRIFEISHSGMMYHGKKAILEIFHDITDRKREEEELIRAKEKAEESDRLKSAFLSNMSHEIRTPMNGILGFADLLKEPDLSTDDQQGYIQTIQISGRRMLNTINNIVDIAKIESGLMNVDIVETNINAKLDSIYKFFKPDAEIKELQLSVKYGLKSEEAIVNLDSEKIYAILTNLVKNAIKFTYDGSVEFGYEKKGEYLEFFVKDTGIGIPKKQKKLIFERFRQGSESLTRSYEGSGLGLSISKSYVEMHGGEIWVESEEGQGSTFYFTIPCHVASEDVKDPARPDPNEVPLKNLKVLIVEDDEISHFLLTRNIEKFCSKILHATTGLEAVDICRKYPDLDLVLMDTRLPQMDGNEATRQIRQFNKTMIIIAQSAYALSGDSDTAMEAGCNDYITKPINKTLLYELIRKHCK